MDTLFLRITLGIPDECEVLSGNSLFGLRNGNVLIGYFGNSNRVLIKNIVESISGGCLRE
jgi:hypothetical protein